MPLFAEKEETPVTERITSRKNPLLQHVKKLLSSRAYRFECGQYTGDGIKLLREAIRWGADLAVVLLTDESLSAEIPPNVRTVVIPPDVMSSVSGMESPQGALFICNMPRQVPFFAPERFLILDGLQDPGNVGTILRTADAFGIPVVLSDGCADLYNPKVVRASMGAVFRTETQTASQTEILSACKSSGIPLYVTALSSDAADIRKSDLRGAVVIGSEGSGVCAFYREAAELFVVIPMSERCESLNAATAAAIVLWEMQR